jgi:quercetin dioxygenase-like cupin family protein
MLKIDFFSRAASVILMVFFANSAIAEKINPLMAQSLSGLKGKEGMMLTVEYAPGEASTKHRHNSNVFVYVLEGSVVMQVEGKPEVTLTPGQTFYESPKDIHTVSRNASSTETAKILVVMVKSKGAAPVLPAK